uniref:Uncharacterized protein n=1 Tax=viral metagenome TaxID=1070528 RepID=A0A6C0JQF2_9ZZZZ
MTSLDSINLDDYQDLSTDEENLLGQVAPVHHGSGSSVSSWTPIIMAIILSLLAYLISSDWINSKLAEVPYYKWSLFGLFFSSVILIALFL